MKLFGNLSSRCGCIYGEYQKDYCKIEMMIDTVKSVPISCVWMLHEDRGLEMIQRFIEFKD